MPSLVDLVPNSEDLLALQPEEIGGVILQVLISAPQNERSNWNRNNFMGNHTIEKYPRNHWDSLRKVLMEGWAWLESEGLIAPEPEQTGNWIFVTRAVLPKN